jgi:hypothetical protein
VVPHGISRFFGAGHIETILGHGNLSALTQQNGVNL